MDLASIVASIEADGDGFRVPAPDGWYQGRALYGGLAAALCLATARRAHPDLPPLRSAQVTFLAPAPGTLRFVPTVLRAGRSTTFVSVDCAGENGLAVRTVLTLGSHRDSAIGYDRLPAPAVAAPDTLPPLPEDAPTPDFFGNFEMRRAGGAMPLSGAPVDEILGWVRFREDPGPDPEVALLAMGDVLPPAAYVSMTRPVPISSMTWHVDVAQPLATTPWYLVRSLGEQADAGYARQAMTCWDADRRCIAVGRQTVALFG